MIADMPQEWCKWEEVPVGNIVKYHRDAGSILYILKVEENYQESNGIALDDCRPLCLVSNDLVEDMGEAHITTVDHWKALI